METVKLSKRKIGDDSFKKDREEFGRVMENNIEESRKISDMKNDIERKLNDGVDMDETKETRGDDENTDSLSRHNLIKTDDELIEEKIEEIHHSKTRRKSIGTRRIFGRKKI